MRSASYLEGTRSPDRDGSLTALFRGHPVARLPLTWVIPRARGSVQGPETGL